MVIKVARRMGPRNRQRSRPNTKETAENNTTDAEKSQSRPNTAQRGRRGGRPGNGYFVDRGKSIIY